MVASPKGSEGALGAAKARTGAWLIAVGYLVPPLVIAPMVLLATVALGSLWISRDENGVLPALGLGLSVSYIVAYLVAAPFFALGMPQRRHRVRIAWSTGASIPTAGILLGCWLLWVSMR